MLIMQVSFYVGLGVGN